MRVLLLAGTAEARALAGALADRGADATASLAGATGAPQPLPLPTRTGGFGGAAAFAAYLRSEGIGAVLDATHPFAARIGPRSAAICADLHVPYLRLLRPEWTPGPGDDWAMLDRLEDAANVVPQGATVFVSTGRQTLPSLILPGRDLHIRVIDPPAQPMPEGASLVIGRAPFTETGEARLFQRLGIDWLLTKNSGGAAGLPKLGAARALGLPVAMIRRPAPAGPSVARVEDALAWLEAV